MGPLDEWERCKCYLEAALDGTYTLEDVWHEIEQRNAQFWPLTRSAVVTQIIRHPQCKVLRIWLAGGELDELLRFVSAADNYAREQGCARVEIDGRKGWSRVLPGYDIERVTLTKDV